MRRVGCCWVPFHARQVQTHTQTDNHPQDQPTILMFCRFVPIDSSTLLRDKVVCRQGGRRRGRVQVQFTRTCMKQGRGWGLVLVVDVLESYLDMVVGRVPAPAEGIGGACFRSKGATGREVGRCVPVLQQGARNLSFETSYLYLRDPSVANKLKLQW